MNILTKYLMKQTLIVFCLVLPALCSLYLLIELAEKMDEVAAFGALSVGVAYFMLIIPEIAAKLLPLAVLLSGILSLALIARHSELIAMMASGISPLRIASSILAFACAAACVGVFFQASFVAKATSSAKDIWFRHVEKGQSKGLLKNGSLYFHGVDTIWNATLQKKDATHLKDVRLLTLSSDYKVQGLKIAKEAVFNDDSWVFKDIIEQSLIGENAGKVTVSPEKSLKLNESPSDFVVMRKQAAEQGILELYNGIGRLEKTGLDIQELKTAFWSQLLYPFLGVSMLWCGLAFVIGRNKNYLAVGIALGIGLGIGSWMMWNVLVSLASAGKIPPVLAPLLCHSFLFGLGMWLFVKVFGLIKINTSAKNIP